jgi:hypothetical protein
MSTTKKITKKKLMQILKSEPEEINLINDFLYRKPTQKEWIAGYWRWRKEQEKK